MAHEAPRERDEANASSSSFDVHASTPDGLSSNQSRHSIGIGASVSSSDSQSNHDPPPSSDSEHKVSSPPRARTRRPLVVDVPTESSESNGSSPRQPAAARHPYSDQKSADNESLSSLLNSEGGRSSPPRARMHRHRLPGVSADSSDSSDRIADDNKSLPSLLWAAASESSENPDRISDDNDSLSPSESDESSSSQPRPRAQQPRLVEGSEEATLIELGKRFEEYLGVSDGNADETRPFPDGAVLAIRSEERDARVVSDHPVNAVWAYDVFSMVEVATDAGGNKGYKCVHCDFFHQIATAGDGRDECIKSAGGKIRDVRKFMEHFDKGNCNCPQETVARIVSRNQFHRKNTKERENPFQKWWGSYSYLLYCRIIGDPDP